MSSWHNRENADEDDENSSTGEDGNDYKSFSDKILFLIDAR